jgi:serine/threonine protein kinase/tetratricopeptide (TPR) repeat protein
MSSEYGDGPTPSEIVRATSFGDAITSLRDGVCAPGSLDVAYDRLDLEERLFRGPAGNTGEHPPRQYIFVRNFRLKYRIASGGMGSVYLAWCPSAERNVAIKVLHDFDGHQTDVRLLDEARSLARVSHLNVVQIFEVDDAAVWTIAVAGEEKRAPSVGRVAMIVMEFVDGRTLEEWLLERPPWRVITAVFLQVAHGLAEAHRQGLLHCDVTPRNVLVCVDETADPRVTAPTAKLIDFGLSRSIPDRSGDSTPGTSAGAGPLAAAAADPASQNDSAPHLLVDVICGTAGYAAPEQLERGQRIDARSDIFGLCAAMWHALATELPYDPAVLRPGTTVEARSPLTIRREAWPRRLPGWLCELLMRGLHLDPKRRPASMTVLIRELERRLSWRQRMIGWFLVPLASATAALALAFGLSYQPLPAPFGPRDPGVELVWHASRQQTIAESVARADPAVRDAWPELLHAIGEFAAAWERMRGEIRVGAANEWTIEMKRFAGGCLLEARNEFDQILRAIAVSAEQTDARNWDLRIHRWLVGLRPPTACQIPRYAVSQISRNPAADTEPWREHYARGYQHYLEHELDAAAHALDQAMAAATNPVGRARIHFRLALIELDRSRIDAGLAHLHDVLRLTAEDGDTYLRFYALKYLVERSPDPVASIGHYLDALGLIDRMFEGASAEQVAVSQLHVSAVWAVHRAEHGGRFDRCPIDCDTVTRPRHSCPTPSERAMRARLCQQDLLDLAEEASPESRDVQCLVARTRAELLLDRGETSAAEKVALAASSLDDLAAPRTWYPKLYETLARIQIVQGRHADAEVSLRRAVTALITRGEGRGADALNALRLLFALAADREDPVAARAFGEQAWAVLEGHDIQAHVATAIEVLGRLGELYVTSPAVQDDDRGILLLTRGLELAAGSELDDELKRVAAEMHMLLAQARVRKGRLSDAEAGTATGRLGFGRRTD